MSADQETRIRHRCGPGVHPINHDQYPETFTVSVGVLPSGGLAVTLESTDGDGGYPNIWWDFTPDTAYALANLLTHHADIAREHHVRGDG